MSDRTSLADCAVEALSAVRSMDNLIDNDHPMRHVVWTMKRMAEQILSDAMRQSTDLAYQARQVIKDHDASLIECAKAIKEQK
jgi:methylthioribose-1-phosphate isomerase